VAVIHLNLHLATALIMADIFSNALLFWLSLTIYHCQAVVFYMVRHIFVTS